MASEQRDRILATSTKYATFARSGQLFVDICKGRTAVRRQQSAGIAAEPATTCFNVAILYQLLCLNYRYKPNELKKLACIFDREASKKRSLDFISGGGSQESVRKETENGRRRKQNAPLRT